jgi:hypothetical protein
MENPYDPHSPYEPSWRIYFEDEPGYRAVFYDPDKLTEYCNTIPPDIAFKIVNQDADVVYQFNGRANPIDYSNQANWKNNESQSVPHNRMTYYLRVQRQQKPSSYRRKDAKGEAK